jgi:hypothetical protein
MSLYFPYIPIVFPYIFPYIFPYVSMNTESSPNSLISGHLEACVFTWPVDASLLSDGWHGVFFEPLFQLSELLHI